MSSEHLDTLAEHDPAAHPDAPAHAAERRTDDCRVRTHEPAAGGLSVVGTPIGNLGDLSPRAVDALAAADAVCCEDTRVTGKLLAHAGISKPLIRCDENVIAARTPHLVERMAGGERLAFASDAGMPAISDPGQVLVDAARDAGVPVEVIPGPSACVTALVSSGIACEHFFFEGFLPRKEGERARRLARLAAVPGALVFYESPHRIEATLASLAKAFPTRMVALCRELTKLHEEVLRAPAPDLLEQVQERGELRGEMVVVVAPPAEDEMQAAVVSQPSNEDPEEALRRDIVSALDAGEAASGIAKRLSQRYSRRRRDVYNLVIALQTDRADA
ncbi:16S rRNA (cytidine(1402)-2'-O)-methyltransferase [Collinsella sp. An2]|uniref:16S rRNA (cytidine(1402)-2'-O)-methyltransferase n=1 Tax=Collinsella sp. An2 TaxID=1965585 RepID=UPI000B3898D1|nr:16S rRNA (cytidine(1402)-2'-O)-methyltransferase [Collinsella sp. An2]OUP07428.1 16S rRNA (cytidine(1402)-2'-O)-methyltransferase [Collinsella sp. An2]